LQEQLRIRRQFVSDHELFDRVYGQCLSWCEDVAARLELCLETDDSRASVESKLSQLNELSSQCDDKGAGFVQSVRDAAVAVLPSTSLDGCHAINTAVSELVTYWETLLERMSSARHKLEAALVSCIEFDASVSKLLQQLSDAEEERNRLSMLQSTLSEKVSCSVHSRVSFVSTLIFLLVATFDGCLMCRLKL